MAKHRKHTDEALLAEKRRNRDGYAVLRRRGGFHSERGYSRDRSKSWLNDD